MSVGFGFSAGDFIAAVNLVGTVIDALRDSGDASSEYRSLISQLLILETALLKVKRLELDDSQHAEVVALRQAAAQCQNTIDQFWEKIKKYQPSLRTGGSGSRVRDGWRKVKWAVCKKEDVARFKADLMAHTESIELLLTTVQMAATRIGEKKNEECHRTLAGRMQDSYFGCMQRMTVILETVSDGMRQGRQLLEMTAKVIQTNVQIFRIVLNIQNIITRVPGQVELQQPVHFIDALGIHTSFQLDFITSAEMLTHVLQYKFRNIGTGAAKIGKGEFAIQDSSTKRDVDLKLPWEAAFRPGQQVAMSMVFNSAKATNMYCPTCREDNGDDFAEDEDIECRKCKMIYRRSISWTTPQPLPSFSMTTAQITPATEVGLMDFEVPETASPAKGKGKRKKPHDEDEEMALFRRVRIKTSIVLPAADSRPGSPVGEKAGQRSKPTYHLQCEWKAVGCEADFSAEDYTLWISHSETHFLSTNGNGNSDGQLSTVSCPLCSKDYRLWNEDVTLRHQLRRNFVERMYHIREHLENGEKLPAEALYDRNINPALAGSSMIREPSVQDIEHIGNAENSLDNIVEGGRRKRALKRQRHIDFDQYKLPDTRSRPSGQPKIPDDPQQDDAYRYAKFLVDKFPDEATEILRKNGTQDTKKLLDEAIKNLIEKGIQDTIKIVEEQGHNGHRSKTGCITCRKSKKKCDERKPGCLNCERNTVDCEGYQLKTLWKSGKERALEEAAGRGSESRPPSLRRKANVSTKKKSGRFSLGESSESSDESLVDESRQDANAPPHLPKGWIAQWDSSSRKFYFIELSTGSTQWDIPTKESSAKISRNWVTEPYDLDDSSREDSSNDKNHDSNSITLSSMAAQLGDLNYLGLTSQHTHFLNAEFIKQPNPDAAQCERLALYIPGIGAEEVHHWFQNRRAGYIREQTPQSLFTRGPDDMGMPQPRESWRELPVPLYDRPPTASEPLLNTATNPFLPTFSQAQPITYAPPLTTIRSVPAISDFSPHRFPKDGLYHPYELEEANIDSNPPRESIEDIPTYPSPDSASNNDTMFSRNFERYGSHKPPPFGGNSRQEKNNTPVERHMSVDPARTPDHLKRKAEEEEFIDDEDLALLFKKSKPSQDVMPDNSEHHHPLESSANAPKRPRREPSSRFSKPKKQPTNPWYSQSTPVIPTGGPNPVIINNRGLQPEPRRSFADAIDASRGMLAMSQDTTPRNISSSQGTVGSGSGDPYGFPTTHSSSSVSENDLLNSISETATFAWSLANANGNTVPYVPEPPSLSSPTENQPPAYTTTFPTASPAQPIPAEPDPYPKPKKKPPLSDYNPQKTSTSSRVPNTPLHNPIHRAAAAAAAAPLYYSTAQPISKPFGYALTDETPFAQATGARAAPGPSMLDDNEAKFLDSFFEGVSSDLNYDFFSTNPPIEGSDPGFGR